MMNTIQGMIEFLGASCSAFHAIDALARKLKSAGYMQLQEGAAWDLAPGGKYFLTRNQSSLIAFAIPQCGFAPLQIVASHSDSPVFKLKKAAQVESQGHYVQLNVEKYGGMLMNTWLDRPLSIAGRVIVKNGTKLETRLVNVDRDLVLIPNLAIHMNRDLADGGKYNAQVDMMPLLGGADAKGKLDAIIAEAAGAEAQQIVGSDLYLYNRMQPSVWGASGEYISAPRLDDLECAYTSTEAFIRAVPGKHINMLCVFDNEEVGSGTRQGADSMLLLRTVVQRLAEKGYVASNVDVTIVAQRPKLKDFIPQMNLNVAAALGIPPECVNVKATTTEKLGFEGEGLGISAQSVAMIRKI